MWGLLWRRKWLVALGALVGLSMGYLYFARAEKIFESVAEILIEDRRPQLPTDNRNDFDNGVEVVRRDALATQMRVIKSQTVIDDAIETDDLSSLPSFAGASALATIIKNLEAVKGGPDSERDANVLFIGLRGPDPKDCQQALKAILDSYDRFLKKEYKDVSLDTLTLISDAYRDLDQERATLDGKYRTFLENSPLVWRGDSGENIYEARILQIEAERADIQLRRAERTADLRALVKSADEGIDPDALAIAVYLGMPVGTRWFESPRDEAMAQIEKEQHRFNELVFPLLLQEQLLLQDYGVDHPKVQAVKQQIKMTQDLFPDLEARQQSLAESPPPDFVQLYVQSLKQQLDELGQREQILNELFETERANARNMLKVTLADAEFKAQIERNQKMFEALAQRMQEIELLRAYANGGLITKVLTAPGVSTDPVEPKLFSVMAIAGVLGLLAGFGLAYMVELADKSFRSPEEIRYRLGVPVVGHIPVLAPELDGSAVTSGDQASGRVDPIVCTLHRPKSRQAEAYRAVRTALYFSTRGGGHKVIQVTSPDPGDGKTTLAANLAVSIANSGKKILLIDADFRRPRIHRIFGQEAECGFSSVINGEAELPDAIQPTCVENLSIMPCGPKPSNPAELLTLPRVKELIDVLRDDYDFVMLDTPPVLVVTDPCAVAPRVDGVLLTIRISKNARPDAVRAAGVLSTLGAKVLGVVVNGVGPRVAYGLGRGYTGYRYGGYKHYRYGSYGGEGYGDASWHSGHGYGYGAYDAYYADDTPATTGNGNGTRSDPEIAAAAGEGKRRGMLGWFRRG
jgi:capsular exopolysaccharide synthesis family protein